MKKVTNHSDLEKVYFKSSLEIKQYKCSDVLYTDMTDYFKYWIRKDKDKKYGIVYILDGRIVAAAFIAKLRPSEVWISYLMVDVKLQNQGIGTVVMKHLINKEKCNYLNVVKTNARAIHVYEKLGFKKVKDRGSSYVMKK